MSQTTREEILDEVLVKLRKVLKSAQGKTYNPSNIEIFRIEQIKDVITELANIQLMYK